MFEISTEIPLPSSTNGEGQYRSDIARTMSQLPINGSFFIPGMTMNKATAKTSEFRRRHQPTWTFQHHARSERDADGKEVAGVRIWRGPDRETESSDQK